MVTMKEIANKAGVSVSTVSLVLNGRDEGRVKSKIADNVRAIATKLGYQSNRWPVRCVQAGRTSSVSSVRRWPPPRTPAV